ncbi:glutathione S-transferase family protein [Acinetobacter sp. ANC 4779]|uniref:glutathione S-transferase family protein n=1 Tax=Acinetobacter sp. ANC 4779 TaxID=2529848 RepID=UPI00103982BC|nr:glutathione S-transferase family protein [Acinetobacter sp. ANC 4779]TCB49384.1 glutathione S-transferase family protein [Acinetobacter sp. ANC 4779]
MYQLYIANKNYSSWSMRPWLVLKAFNLPFEEILLPFPLDRGTGTFKQKVRTINPNGKVPVLIDDGLMLWDSLAICEYLAEQHPDQALWPQDIKQRARARCITAEMHSGFPTLRNACAMNIRANLDDVGRRLWQDNAELRQDVARIEQIWSERPESHRFLCGEFSIADAFYAPMVMRLMTYNLPVIESTQQYMQTMLQHAAVKVWMDGALQEDAWVNYLESYQQKPL